MDTVQSSRMNAVEQLQKSKDKTLMQLETAYDAISSQGDTLYISESGRNAGSGMDSFGESQSEADGKVILKSAGKKVLERK